MSSSSENDGTLAHEHHSHRHQVADPTTTTALLKYMLDHNEHHAEELHGLVHQLRQAGNAEAADAAAKALELYRQGNAELARAVQQL